MSPVQGGGDNSSWPWWFATLAVVPVAALVYWKRETVKKWFVKGSADDANANDKDTVPLTAVVVPDGLPPADQQSSASPTRRDSLVFAAANQKIGVPANQGPYASNA